MEENELKIDEVEETEETTEATETESEVDWKAEAEKFKASAIRYKNQVEKLKTTPKEAPTEIKNEGKGFDYAEKAYLKASGIKVDEFDFVREVAQSTGKSLDDILENKYFQADLKERREAKSVSDALPTGTKRSGNTARNTVDYWVAKGELPPADQVDLRRQVVNERIKRENQKSRFSDNPIV